MSSHNEGPGIPCSAGTAAAAAAPTKPGVQANSRSMFTCSVCSAVIKYRSNFVRHLERRHKMCRECNTVFWSSYELGIHKESCPTPREYSCAICGGQFPTKRLLLRHSHDKAGAFPCDICLRTFRTAVVQAAHRRRHFWRGLPRCRVCSATFASEQHLSRHIRNHERETSEVVRY